MVPTSLPELPKPSRTSGGNQSFKGIHKELKGIFPKTYIKIRVLKLRFWAFSDGPGGFRELREAGRNHFHLSWYLSDAVVTSSSPAGGIFFYRLRYVGPSKGLYKATNGLKSYHRR